MRTSIIALLLAGYFSVMLPQEKIGMAYSEPQSTAIYDIFSAGMDGNGTLQILKRDSKKDFIVESYNGRDLSLEATQVYSVTGSDNANVLPEHLTPVELITLNNENYLVLSAINSSASQQIIALTKIDLSGKPAGPIIQLGSFNLTSEDKELPLDVKCSSNKTFLVISAPESASKEDAYNMDFILYNILNHSISFYVLETDFISKWTNPGKVMVSDKGQIFVTIKEEQNSSWRPSKMDEKSIKLFISQKEDRSFKSVELKLPDSDFSTLAYVLEPKKNTLEFWGMYSNIDHAYGGDEADGIFNISVDPKTCSILKTTKTPMLKDIVAEVHKKKISKVYKEEGISNKYVLKQIMYGPDGNWLFFEKKTTFTSNNYTPAYGSNEGYHHFRFDSLLVLKTDMNCNIIGHTIIPKDQISINDKGIYSSVIITRKGNTALLFFNDFIKNTDPAKKVWEMTDPAKAGFFVVSLNMIDGRWNKKLIKKNLSDKNIVIPNPVLVTQNDNIFGLFSKGSATQSEKQQLGIYRLSY